MLVEPHCPSIHRPQDMGHRKEEPTRIVRGCIVRVDVGERNCVEDDDYQRCRGEMIGSIDDLSWGPWGLRLLAKQELLTKEECI